MSDPAELIERSAETAEEAQEAGFFGHVKSYPNELHHTGNEVTRQATFQVTETVPAPVGGPDRASLEGATVNTDSAPPPATVSGPGAAQPSKQDENEEDEG